MLDEEIENVKVSLEIWASRQIDAWKFRRKNPMHGDNSEYHEPHIAEAKLELQRALKGLEKYGIDFIKEV